MADPIFFQNYPADDAPDDEPFNEAPQPGNQDGSARIPTAYGIHVRYEHHEGLLQMPVAGPPGTAAVVVRVCAPHWTKSVRWVAERQGAKPVLPHWDTGTSNEVLQYKTLVPVAPAVMPQHAANFRHTYRVQGLYVYLLRSPPPDASPLAVGRLPFDPLPAVAHSLENYQFDRTVLGPGDNIQGPP
jgi:hypothetical protein